MARRWHARALVGYEFEGFRSKGADDSVGDLVMLFGSTDNTWIKSLNSVHLCPLEEVVWTSPSPDRFDRMSRMATNPIVTALSVPLGSVVLSSALSLYVLSRFEVDNQGLLQMYGDVLTASAALLTIVAVSLAIVPNFPTKAATVSAFIAPPLCLLAIASSVVARVALLTPGPYRSQVLSHLFASIVVSIWFAAAISWVQSYLRYLKYRMSSNG